MTARFDRLGARVCAGSPDEITQLWEPAMSKLSRNLYIPLSTAASIGGGLLAGKIFSTVWQQIDDNDPPDPQDLEQPMTSALVAAALQGVVWGVVRAVVQRAGAHSYQAITAERPPT